MKTRVGKKSLIVFSGAAVLFSLCAAFASAAEAAPESKWNLRFSLGTAAIEYGSKTINDRFKYNSPDMSRVVVSLDGLAEYALSKPVHLVLGLAGVADLNFGGGGYQHYTDFGLLAGFRFIPLAPWFSFEVEYAVGQRYDFLNLSKPSDKHGAYYTPWSNGFRVGAECMLGYLTYRIVPIVGVNWRWMPRVPLGSDPQTDKIFSLYIAFRYQKNTLDRVNRR